MPGMQPPRPGNTDGSPLMKSAVQGLFPTNTLPWPRLPVGKNKGHARVSGPRRSAGRGSKGMSRGRGLARKKKAQFM